MEQIFKEGDKVFDIRYGWGLVVSVNMLTNDWPVEVVFNGKEELLDEYTFDGRAFINYPPTLSFTEYTLEGFSQERPEPLPKPGDIVWVRDTCYDSWMITYFRKFNNDATKTYGCNPRNSADSLSIYYYKYLTTKNPYANEK
jgi:hypothetical protein